MAAAPIQNPKQEFWGVLALALGFGLVGIDRFLISTMFPTIAHDLHLSYGGIGVITGALAIAWGFAALIMGNLSDRIGQRIVLTGALIVFSLLIGTSGLATSLLGLVFVRVLMGFADGAYTPASIAATIAVSPEERHGRTVGLQQTTLVLFGLGLAPILVGYLLHFMSWRLIFSIFLIPGLLLAFMLWKVIPSASATAETPKKRFVASESLEAWKSVLAYRNIWVLMGCMLCWLTCLVTTSALLPSYMLDYLKIDTAHMGQVMSAIGLGAAAGAVLLSWLSDTFGRKPVMLLGAIGASLCLYRLHTIGPNPASLFLWLFLVHLFNNGLITLTVGPICTETVPVGLMATASGVVIAIGEFFGGGLAPILAGQMAERFGIQNILWLPQATLAGGFLLCLFLIETLPAKAHARSAKA